MQQFKFTFQPFLILTLIITLLPGAIRSQSGRGRPKVPSREPAAPAPPPTSVPAAAAIVKQEQAGNTTRFVLRNGMTVIISEQHASPIAATAAYFKVGQLDEPDALTGVARLLGETLFKGAQTRPAINSRSPGALIGADTSYDGTSFHMIVAPGQIKEALAIQANLIQNPTFQPDELRRTATAIVEQERLLPAAGNSEAATAGLPVYGDPARYSLSRLYNIAFTRHRLGRQRTTAIESLPSIAREQVVEFYRYYYRPERLIIAVVGDVSTFNTLVEIQRLYGGFGAGKDQASGQAEAPKEKPQGKAQSPSRRAAAVSRPSPSGAPADADAAQESPKPEISLGDKSPAEPDQTGLRYAADRAEISQSVVSAGYHVPGSDSKERAVIEVLATLAGQGRGSRLSRAFLDAQAVVSRVESDYLAVNDAGLLTFQIWVEPKGIDKAESILFNELDRLRREVPAEGEMGRAKALLEKRFIDSTSTYIGKAQVLARAEATRGEPRAASDYRTQVRAVSAEDVQRAAAKYFTLANTSLHEYEPLTATQRTFDAAAFAATVTAWAPLFAQPVNAKEVRPTDSNYSPPVAYSAQPRSDEQQAALESVQPLPLKDFSTLNGPSAFVREDHTQPKTAIALLFQGGRDIEDESNSGITGLMLRAMLYGSSPRPAKAGTLAWSQELEHLGASVEVVAEPDFFGFVISVLSGNSDRALKVIRDAIEESSFRDEEINRARVEQVGMIRAHRDRGLERSREMLFQALFAGHSYSLPPHGREEVVARLGSEQVGKWYAETVKRQVPLVIIVGDTAGSALISGAIAEGFKRRDIDRALQVKVPPVSAPAEKIEQRRQRHTVFSLGAAGPKRSSNDLIVIELIETLMNGAGGRLLRELGDKQNLAYDARLNHEAMFTAGAIYAYAVTSPENEPRARTSLLAEIDRLSREAVSGEEMASARALAAGAHLARLQSYEARAMEYARAILFQQPGAEVDSFAERLAKVTPDDIKRVAGLYFKSSATSAGVVRGAARTAPQTSPKQD